MKFDTLVGQVLPFYGVDNNCFKIGEWVFEAVEDENDGYRSMMDEVREITTPSGLIFFRDPVAMVKVSTVFDVASSMVGYALDDESGHRWLLFGTENYDDYYPCFIFSYAAKKG